MARKLVVIAEPEAPAPVSPWRNRIVGQGSEAPDQLLACKIAPGNPDHFGYGRVVVNKQRYRAHRVAWEQATGHPVPAGMHVCHTCDNRSCIQNDGHGVYVVDGVEYERWGHLWLGDDAANVKDMWAKGRSPKKNVPCGDSHWTRRDPERARAAMSIARSQSPSKGDEHWTRKEPERARAVAIRNLSRIGS